MTPLDSHAEAIAAAAFHWTLRDNRLAEMRGCINRLDRVQVLTVLHKCRDMQAELLERLRVTTDEAVAYAALTPDALPDDIGDGFAINGRPTLPQRVAEACAYCGKEDCDERFDHERADAANEETWMRRARS